MQLLLKNRLIILLVIAIVLALAFKKTAPALPPPVIAKQPTKTNTVQPVSKQEINPNPNKINTLKNPFKPTKESLLPDSTQPTVQPNLVGIISHESEFLAIISVSGKTDFYKPNQKISGYTVKEINSTSVVLFDEVTSKRLILHIKE